MSSLSHDLYTPLNIIIGFSELMLDEVPGPINANQRQCLNDILSSSRRLLELLDSRLGLPEADTSDGRDEAGKRP